MSDWRSRLTADEADNLALIEGAIAGNKRSTRQLQKDRKAIMNRAIQRAMAARKKSTAHPIKGVDTIVEAH